VVNERGEATERDARDETARLRRALEGVLGVPATEDNHIEALRNGDEIFPAMLEAIDGAETTIDFLTFVYWQGEIGTQFAERLAERAQHGVRVRVLLDAWGSQPMDTELVDLMQHAGVRVHRFRPLSRLKPGDLNHRTHRKVLIVDEETAFTGGVGIADEWQGDARNEDEWRDTHFCVRGPAVDGLRSAFLDNWAETDAELFDESVDRFPDQPQAGRAVIQCIRGGSETGWSDIATLYRTLLQLARRCIRITTAYFVPDEELTRRLCDAAARGVQVQILLPGPHIDKRFVQVASEASYERLLDAGIELWCFQPSMLHAKVLTIDGLLANVGSANFNSRSIAEDEEVNLVVLDRDLTAELDRHFDEDLERSERIDPTRWEDRKLTQRVIERAVDPVRRLL
jgi:cardiolipin synthase